MLCLYTFLECEVKFVMPSIDTNLQFELTFSIVINLAVLQADCGGSIILHGF